VIIPLILMLSIVALWYIAAFYLAIKPAGIDPTLITHITPLRFFDHWLLICLFVAATLYSFGSFYPLIPLVNLALLCTTHISALIIFGRTQTQPTYAYIWVLAGCVLLISGVGWGIPAAEVCLLSAAYVLFRWPKVKEGRYNLWVKHKTLNIHRRFWPLLAGKTTELDWYCTLLVATTESIARPKLSRMLEQAYFIVKKPKQMSSGIMQVMSSTYLTDPQSLLKGHELISKCMKSMPASVTSDADKMAYLAHQYNGSYNYQKYLLYVYPGFTQAWHKVKLSGL
jgi:hypothetical protein